MNVLYRGLLTLEACSWMLIVFVVKNETPILGVDPFLIAAILATLTVLGVPFYKAVKTPGK